MSIKRSFQAWKNISPSAQPDNKISFVGKIDKKILRKEAQ